MWSSPQYYGNRLRRRRTRLGDRWHLDEDLISINGTIYYLRRAVDEHGAELDILVRQRRNALATRKFFRKLLRGRRCVPRVIVTDGVEQLSPEQRRVE
ncbi:DDE-type integrase/transposase/recombinase [Aldersonia sp. NBC_00410]|uniref:DDE-type integrase/transposase/recombinase n=1 Tax=Aldersonia sp. NBC_00410 TaxID=2975954 RepID=UPI002B1D3641|nr:DDE-type integrase/transposase/recombinase [Aldersonia sp. NBC_00410]